MNLVEEAFDLFAEGFNPLPLKDDKAPLLPTGHPYLYNKVENIDKLFGNLKKKTSASTTAFCECE